MTTHVPQQPQQPIRPRREFEARSRNNASQFLMPMLLIVGSAFLSPAATVFCLINLIPTVTAAVVDKERDHTLSYSVGFCNLAGIFPYAFDLYRDSASFGQMFTLLQSPLVWLVTLLGSAVGWGVYYAMPKIVHIFMVASTQSKIHKLQQKEFELRKEWGEDL